MTARRDFFAFTASAVAAKTVLPLAARAAPNPDAELIDACVEYLRLERAFDAYYEALPGYIAPDDPGWAILEPVPALVERIVTLQATTMEGHFARSRCLAYEHPPESPDCQDDPKGAAQDRFYAAFLRDLVRLEWEVA